MMEAALPRSWKEQFAVAAAIREEDIKHREKLIRFDARQRQMSEDQRIAAQKRDAETWAMIENALASSARIADFRMKLDTYETKTVEALMENQEAMEHARERLDGMLDKGHMLADGRRVFKTADGQRVFDEEEREVGADIVDPSSIDDRRPKWEEVKAERDTWISLGKERQQLLDYQAKLDDSRDRIAKDGLTDAELTEMEADLRDAMPDAVRAKVEPDRPRAEAALSTPSMPDGMDALMRQSGLGPSPMAGPR